MEGIIVFLHLLGSIGMGFYLLFPFLLMKKDDDGGRAKIFGHYYIANRAGQVLLIVQFLTGGYMLSMGNYSTGWIIVVILVFLIIGGLTAIMGKRLKAAQADLESGNANQAVKGEIQLFSWLVGLCFLVIVILMGFPTII